MLIGFKFRNFRSFLKEQSFVLAASSDRTHVETHCVETGIKAVPQLLKTAIVFGSNASGKSNFVAALETLRNLVLYSTFYSAEEFAARYTPCWHRSTRHEPISFEIELLLDKVRYRYSISFDSRRVLHERLLVFESGKSQRWFDRQFNESTNEDEWARFSAYFDGPHHLWRRANRPATLFLTTAAQLKSVRLQPLYAWFQQRLDFMHSSKTTGVAGILPQLRRGEFKSRMLGHLKSLDIRVEDVRIAEPEAGSDKTQIEFLYSDGRSASVWRRFEHESAGAHRLFGLIGHLFCSLDEAKLLVVDDFGLNLHSLVARQLVRLIHDPKTSCAQWILISHNVSLMDLTEFRRDQIWLTRVDEMNTSHLYTVSRASPRRYEQIGRGYLQGRYGGIPKLPC